MLKIENLKVSYGGIEAVKGISFSVEQGQIVTLIGANGAGKSTTLRTVVGLVKAASGSIVYEGEELTGLPADQIVRRGITLVPEGRRVFPDLTTCRRILSGSIPSSPASRSATGSRRARCRAGSSRCLRWGGRS